MFITGYSIRAPSSKDRQEFYHNLVNGNDMTTETQRYPNSYLNLPNRTGTIPNLEKFDYRFFKYNKNQVDKLDIGIRHLHEVVHEALMDSNNNINSLRGSKTGVYIGHCFSDYFTRCNFDENKNGYGIVNNAHSMAANKISFFYDFKGPSLVIDTACSSSLVALNHAFQDIKEGNIDRAIVGGISITTNPNINACFNAFKMLSPDGRCYSFDERANGYCRSEGIGAIVIESERVCKYGYSKILGIGVNNDGNTSKGITFPSSQAQSELGKSVLQKYNISPDSIAYIEAHGTGTKAGDNCELNSLNAILEGNHETLPIGSVKSNMGHAEGASGLMSIIKCLLMFEHQQLLPNINFKSTKHQLLLQKRFRVVEKIEKWEPGNICICNYGFGGTNALTVISPGNITFSKNGKSKQQLKNICFTNEKQYQNQEFFTIHSSLGNDSFYDKRYFNSIEKKNIYKKNKVAFVFGGQGSQWLNMGKYLFSNNVIFKETIERLNQFIPEEINLVELYNDGNNWLDKKYSVLGIVSYQIAMVNIIREKGITANYFLGHSLGEICCGYFSGIQSEQQTIQIALVRSKLTQKIDTDKLFLISSDQYEFPVLSKNHNGKYVYYVTENYQKKQDEELFYLKGKMWVVGKESSYLENKIKDLGLRETCVACYNSPSGQTISGSKKEVDILINHILCENPKVFNVEINTDNIAYHAPYLQYFVNYLDNEFSKNITKECPLPTGWLSTSNNQLYNYHYHTNNITSSVYFQQAIEKLPLNTCVIEIGSDSGLLSQIKRIRKDLKLIPIIKKNDLNTEKKIDNIEYNLWLEGIFCQFVKVDPSKRLVIQDRTLDIWNHKENNRIFTYKDYNLNQTNTNDENEITLHLKKDFPSIYDHVINNQNLFPFAGYIYLVWKYNHFKPIQINNIKVLQPIIIKNVSKIVFEIKKTSNIFQIYNNNFLVCQYQLSEIEQDIKLSKEPVFTEKNSINKNQFYRFCRLHHFNYGKSYQLINKYDWKTNIFQLDLDNTDYISYIDNMIQKIIITEQKSIYPVGFGKILLRDSKNLLTTDTFWCGSKKRWGNKCIIFEDYDYDTFKSRPIKNTIQTETVWLKYGSNPMQKMEYLPQLLSYNIGDYDILDSGHNEWETEIKGYLQQINLRSNINQTLIVSYDGSGSEIIDFANYMITGEKYNSKKWTQIMNFDQQIYLYTKKNSIDFQLVNNFQQIDLKNKKHFLWYNSKENEGIFGAIRCLMKEGKYNVYGYYRETNCKPIRKPPIFNMRFNYLNSKGEYGCWLESTKKMNYPLSISKYHLQIETPGKIDSLGWIQNCSKFKVEYGCLNFRDIMRAFGKLKEEDMSLGLEFGGYDQGGNKVIGVGRNTIGNYCNAYYTYKLPVEVSLPDASSILITYLTAYYSLFEKGGLKKGDSVLIHSGAGGVGMSCIHLCLTRGINVYTTCSEKKRVFLKKQFQLTDQQIGDSRSLTFKKWLLSQTGGKGVDCVINSLSDKFQQDSLECVAEYGNFCEIGKYDILNNTPIGQKMLEKNISFHVIDLLPMLKNRKFDPLWNKYLDNGFELNEIKPLPVIIFKQEKIKDAFRYMSQGKHIGKVLIHFDHVELPKEISGKFITKGKHLVSGGLGGIGMQLCHYLSERGCQELIIVSRSGIKNGYQSWMLENLPCKVRIIKSSVTQIDLDEKNIEMVWHLAGILDDSLFVNMDIKKWKKVIDVKVNGYYNLRKILPETPIVCFGSVSSLHGNIGQSNYACANNTLENISRKDPNTIIIQLGPVKNVGMASNIEGKILNNVYQFISVNEIFKVFDQGYIFKNRNTAVYSLLTENKIKKEVVNTLNIAEIQQLLSDILGGRNDDYHSDIPLLEYGLDSLSSMEIVNWVNQKCKNKIDPSFLKDDVTIETIFNYVLNNSIKKVTQITNPVKINEIKVDKIQKLLSEILGGSIEDYQHNVPLLEFGLDSLSSMEIINWINERCNKKISPAFITDNITINELYQHISENRLTEDLSIEPELQTYSTTQITTSDIQSLLSNILGGENENYDLETPISQFGIDSLSSMEIISWINERVNKIVDPTFLSDTTNINSIYQYISEKSAHLETIPYQQSIKNIVPINLNISKKNNITAKSNIIPINLNKPIVPEIKISNNYNKINKFLFNIWNEKEKWIKEEISL